MIKKLQATLLLLLITVSITYAQTGTLSGTVTDAETGETIPGANILITELERSAPSDMDGHYEIMDIPMGVYTVNVSFVGYQTFAESFHIRENETTILDVELTVGAIRLEELVVSDLETVDR